MSEIDDSLKKLERDLAHVGFWHAVQMSVLVGVGILLIGILANAPL